jgi:leader peptidase (prepilin peptidase) / N-methyltransferase
MNIILALPMELCLAIVFVLGACIGSAANWAIYLLAWNRRPIGPWSRRDPAAPARRPADRLPIFGWLGLRREAALHGPGFWLRPMVLELLAGFGFAALYWWEIGAAGLLPAGIVRPLPPGVQMTLHLQFAAHCILFGLMLAASMIDVDEKTIPDEITVVGTLLALLLAAAAPWSLLPFVIQGAGGRMGLDFLHLTSPCDWPAWLDGRPQAGSLCLALACWWAWCAALLPRTWYSRHGWLRAAGLCWARLVHDPSTRRILRMALMGAAAVALVWYRGGSGWEGLLSALVGMAAGGGLVWAVRIICSAALRREAMGFGDVTLMAMLGAFLGWQACPVIFFLAPVAGVMIAIVRLVLFRDREIPYGPFLCLAALFLVVCWDAVWGYVEVYYSVGWLVPSVLFGILPLMAFMLGTWRLILGMFAGRRSR